MRTALVMLLGGFLPAIGWGASTVSSVTVTQVSIYAGSSGAQAGLVVFEPARPGMEGCTYSPGNELWIDFSSTTQPDGKALYTTVLAAYLAGRTLSFEVSGCADGGQLPQVYWVGVGP